LPSEVGINGEIRLHWASVRTCIRDMPPTIPQSPPQLLETRPRRQLGVPTTGSPLIMDRHGSYRPRPVKAGYPARVGTG